MITRKPQNLVKMSFQHSCVAAGVTQQTGVCQFRCDNGQCVLATDRCNGVQNCTDGSDEDFCTGIFEAMTCHF